MHLRLMKDHPLKAAHFGAFGAFGAQCLVDLRNDEDGETEKHLCLGGFDGSNFQLPRETDSWSS